MAACQTASLMNIGGERKRSPDQYYTAAIVPHPVAISLQARLIGLPRKGKPK
jgi:hypothetical protein